MTMIAVRIHLVNLNNRLDLVFCGIIQGIKVSKMHLLIPLPLGRTYDGRQTWSGICHCGLLLFARDVQLTKISKTVIFRVATIRR